MNFYKEIEDIQKQSNSMDNDQLARELQYYLQLDTWRSLLLYGGLYISKIGKPPVLAFYAQKTLETVEMVCKKIPGDDDRIAKNDKTTTESGESPLRRILDQLLISLAILVFCFDNSTRRQITESIEHSIRKKLYDSKSRFIDELSLDDYLNILSAKLRESDKTLKSLCTFFDDLIINAGWGKMGHRAFKNQAHQYKKYIERLIREASYKLEKPDRIFSYAESMNDVTHLAESFFDHGKLKGKAPFDKSQWDYLCDNPSERLGFFWVTCMVGLFVFSQSFDR